MEKITKETFKNFNNEKERLFNYLKKLIDIGLSLDKNYDVMNDEWSSNGLKNFYIADENNIRLSFSFSDYDFILPYKAITDEEIFKKWLLNSIRKKREIKERKKQLKKEADEARRRAKINTIKETKIYYRPKELCCTECKYGIGMDNSYDMFCVVDDDIKSGRDKEQCPFYKKEQSNGK